MGLGSKTEGRTQAWSCPPYRIPVRAKGGRDGRVLGNCEDLASGQIWGEMGGGPELNTRGRKAPSVSPFNDSLLFTFFLS